MSSEFTLPAGTVTFLFTDIEGSTQLLRRLGDSYVGVLTTHLALLREACAAYGGHEIDNQGDSLFVAFSRAKDAVSAALTGQRSLVDHEWPEGADLRVRMGIHTGEPTATAERYVGIGVHRAARICAAGHGGQILVSQATRELLRDEPLPGVSLQSLGVQHLKDMDEPEELYQLTASGLSERFPEPRVAMQASRGAKLTFHVLGPVEVRADNRPLPISGQKQLQMLAMLLLHASEVVTVRRLVNELWPAELPADPDESVQALVYQLRKQLDGGGASRGSVLERQGPGYRLRLDDDQLDLRRFERLVGSAQAARRSGDLETAAWTLSEALSLWRGTALANISLETTTATRAQAARLDEVRLNTVIERIEIDLELSREGEVVGELEELIAHHPLDERLRELHMLALYRNGRQADALNAYQQARSTLIDEIGVEPGRRLQALHGSILRHDPSLDPQSTPNGGTQNRSGVSAARSLVAVANRRTDLEPLLSLARILGGSQVARELILVMLAGNSNTISEANAEMAEQRAGLLRRGVETRAVAFTSSRPGHDIARLASREDVDLLLMVAPAELAGEGSIPPDMLVVLDQAPCDVGLLVHHGLLSMDRKVVVPFGGNQHDWAALEIGAWAATAASVRFVLVGGRETSDSDEADDASRLLANASLALQQTARIDAEVRLIESGHAPEFLRAFDSASLVVAGLPEHWRTEAAIGPLRLSFCQQSQTPVLFVRKGSRPGGLAPRDSMTTFGWSLIKR